jgi:hypothetical protein
MFRSSGYGGWIVAKDIVSTLGTLGALAIGVLGLGTWRRQLRGSSEYEVAKKILINTYQVCNRMQAVRSPLTFLQKDEVDAGRKLEEEQRVYNERLQALFEKWAELRALSLETRAIWGTEAEDRTKPIEKLARELRAEVWLHFWLAGAYAGPGTTVDNSPERIAANDKAIYWVSDDDEFSSKIIAAVKHVEEFFRPRMRG